MSNKQWFVDSLSGSRIEQISGGRLKRMPRNAAAALVGNWVVETGSSDLSNLDIVEIGNGNAGRGLSQYTGVRRGPYDRARAQALRNGVDPNSRDWQFQYFVEEYMGKHDGGGGSLIGWTGALENLPQTDTAGYARHFSDNYFRPGVPHLDRRIQEANALAGGDMGPSTGDTITVNNPTSDVSPMAQRMGNTDPAQMIKDAHPYLQ